MCSQIDKQPHLLSHPSISFLASFDPHLAALLAPLHLFLRSPCLLSSLLLSPFRKKSCTARLSISPSYHSRLSHHLVKILLAFLSAHLIILNAFLPQIISFSPCSSLLESLSYLLASFSPPPAAYRSSACFLLCSPLPSLLFTRYNVCNHANLFVAAFSPLPRYKQYQQQLCNRLKGSS